MRTFQKTGEKNLWSFKNYVNVTGKTDKHEKQESGCHDSCKQPKGNDEIMRKYENILTDNQLFYSNIFLNKNTDKLIFYFPTRKHLFAILY